MRIAILGTRGIPNQYGGFEQFAEILSVQLAERGHEVTVYNPHFHEYVENQFHGVNIVRKFSPEKQIGASANFIYDFLCLKDALKNQFDIIYECGYASVALSYLLLPIERSTIITNMDGLEWKRTKWSSLVKMATLKFEKIAVEKSHYLVSDNEGIRQYFLKTYNVHSQLIEYGANPVIAVNPHNTLKKYYLNELEFFLLIARIEPENNIEMILKGFVKSQSKFPIIVIGNVDTTYGQYLVNTYSLNCPEIRFAGAIYDAKQLNDLRNTCLYYFHGHSVGGTNPSLLEAMAAKSFIAAHENYFNKSVLTNNALFFKNSEEVSLIIVDIEKHLKHKEEYLGNNLEKIETYYSWDNIVKKHIAFFNEILNK